VSRITALFVGIAARPLSQRSPKLRMAADAGGITTGDGACRRTSPPTDTGVITGRLQSADQCCGLISVAAVETKRDTPHQIQPLRRGTTVRRISRFRMGCASRTQGQDVRPEALPSPHYAHPCRTNPRHKSGKARIEAPMRDAND
jgi:hypothetical protein